MNSYRVVLLTEIRSICINEILMRSLGSVRIQAVMLKSVFSVKKIHTL